jgi:L-threonylcarbamoyladenylate synthase
MRGRGAPETKPERRGADTLPAEVLKVSKGNPEAPAIFYAAQFISRGQVVGMPTDTFYGLGADPFNLAAVEEIYRVKGRPETRALPILVNSIEQAITLTGDLPESFLKLAQKFWPGALTLLVDASHRLPRKVTANQGRVALRWPDSPVACALIEQLGAPITGTSANISGRPSCSNAEQLISQLGTRLPLILDSGDTGGVLSSTIVDLRAETWHIVREGAVSESDLRKALA